MSAFYLVLNLIISNLSNFWNFAQSPAPPRELALKKAGFTYCVTRQGM